MFGFAFLLRVAQPALEPPPLHGARVEEVCPVGGERFEAWRATAYSIFGERPDGRPYSYLPFPLPLPECPGNHLVVFDQFTPSETASLSRLIGSEAYRQLVAEPGYFRAYWLANRLGQSTPQVLSLLLSAIWQVSPVPGLVGRNAVRDERLRRYQTLFVARVSVEDATIGLQDGVWLQARAANAARQLGRFGEAERLRRKAGQTLAGVPGKGGWDVYLTRLRGVIARRDAGIEPIDMIPATYVPSACLDRQTLGPFERDFCTRPGVADAISRLRATRANQR